MTPQPSPQGFATVTALCLLMFPVHGGHCCVEPQQIYVIEGISLANGEKFIYVIYFKNVKHIHLKYNKIQ